MEAQPLTLQHHCRLLHHGTVTIDQRWVCRLHDPFWRLYRNRDTGAVIIDQDGVEFPLVASACVLVPAWSRFTTRCAGPVRHTFLHFDPVALPAAWVRERCTKLVTLPRRRDWDALLDVLPISDARDWAPHLRCQAMLCEAVALAVGAAGSTADTTGVARPTDVVAVEPAVLWIDNHIADPLPVDLLARRCGLGRDRFTRVFTSAMGSSPARYVAERRVTAAALRLLSSDDGIEQVAEQVGFANRYHFSRVFHRILGTSPAAYRRQGRLG